MPVTGWETVTVPGAVDVWIKLSERLGSLPFEVLFQPAIRYAREGFLVSPKTAYYWSLSAKRLNKFPEFASVFLPGGQSPRCGELFRCEDQAKTLEIIAESRGE